MSDARYKRSARIARLYHQGPVSADTTLELDKEASHHLGKVLRTRVGDPIILFNGDGNDYHATVVDTGQMGTGKRCILHIDTCTPGIPDSPLAITLVQSVSRPERMDISLRQAVELGVTRIQPVYSKQSIKVTDEKRASKKQQHWQSIVISACEQSGRAVIPELCDAISYSIWVQNPKEADDVHFVLAPQSTHSLMHQLNNLLKTSPARKVTLIVGPESGLDPHEIHEAVNAGAVPVNLGRRILRTETAGPACIMLLQSILGDLQA